MGLYLLLGPLLLVISLIFRIYLPKEINHYYGYRTRSSMTSKEMWRLANEYSSRLLVMVALGLNLIQAVLFFTIERNSAFLIVSAFMVLGVLLIIPLTEVYLRKKK